MMTLKEVYYKVRAHLLTQGPTVKAAGYPICVYRGAKNTSCAVGCLIADEHYHENFEGHTIRDNDSITGSIKAALELSGVPINGATTLLLTRLQTIHDSLPQSLWLEELNQIAERYGF